MTLANSIVTRPIPITFSSLLALSLVFNVALAQRSQDTPNYVYKSAPLVLDEKTTVPSHVLKPGKYSLEIVDRFSDRYILRIQDAEGKAVGTFIGLHDVDLASYVVQHHEGPILWDRAPKGSPAALRGFSFPDGNTLEFVYPKADAVALAKANGKSVVAIDPESEGRKADPKLTPEDREVVTLWMLTPTEVGKNQDTPAIEARRYIVPEAPKQGISTQPLVARNEAPPQPAAASSAVAQASTPKPRTRAFAAKLPQTASDLPLLALLSLGMLFTATTLRLSRSRN